VISGCGRLGEWCGVRRYGGQPDLLTLAKGLTSAYSPMGAVTDPSQGAVWAQAAFGVATNFGYQSERKWGNSEQEKPHGNAVSRQDATR